MLAFFCWWSQQNERTVRVHGESLRIIRKSIHSLYFPPCLNGYAKQQTLASALGDIFAARYFGQRHF